MKKSIYALFLLLVLGAGLHQVMAQCNAPIINNFSPNTGFIGSTVTITGANFDANPANNKVYFGATKATVLTASFGVLTVTVPVGASTAPISVTNSCNKTAYSAVSFNGIFCPTPLNASTYQNQAFILPSCGAYNMTHQDMDLDGKPEVLAATYGCLTIAKNNSTPGNLSFSASNFNIGGGYIVTADFDGDGLRDVYYPGVVHRNTSSGPGNISISPVGITAGSGGYQCTAGDYNNDGKIDVASGNGSQIFVAFNTSTGPGNISFGPAFVVGNVGFTCTGLQSADVDGDGKTDILGTQGNANRAVSLRNTTSVGATTPTFEAPEFWNSNGNYPYRCQIADFDKDGKIDLTTCNFQGTTNTAVFRNTSVPGDISFANAFTMPAPTANYRIGVGDVNGDGLPDVVTKSLGQNVFSVYPNISNGPGNIAFGPRVDYSSSAQAEVSGIVIGDLDGDFVPDIATSGISSNRIIFHRNTSSQVDNTPPTAACKNITVALSPTGTTTVTAAMIDNGSSDACGIGSLQINSAASVTFTCADIGANTVTLTVTDRAGNISTCQATVTVAPAAVIVAGQTTVCQGQTVLMQANTGDSYQWYLDGVLINGATGQTYTASVSGNYSVAVTNAGGCSGTSAPVTITINNNPTVAISPASSAFLCSGNAILTASQSAIYQWKLNGNNINGATLQSYSATAPGNYSVAVIDLFGCSATSDEVVVSAGNPVINITGNGNTISNGDVTASLSDDTDFGTAYPGTPVVKTFTIQNTGNVSLPVNSITMSGAAAGNFSVGGLALPASIPAGESATFTVTFVSNPIQVYDAVVNVNSSSCTNAAYSFAVKAEISCVPPSIVCPDNIQVNTDAGLCGAKVNFDVTVGGIPAPAVTYSHAPGSVFPVGTTVVTATASSACGTVSCSFSVTVTDNEAPIANCKTANITLANGVAVITAASVDNGSSDNCGIASISVSKTQFTCADLGANQVTLTVTDVNGNTSTCIATVNVAGTIPVASITAIPSSNVFTGGVPTNIYLGYGAQSVNLSANISNGGAPYTYQWTGSGVLSSNNSASPVFAPTVPGNYNFTVLITNVYGCTSTATISICVRDVRVPGTSGKKVYVCHVPPGNPSNAQTLSISVNAVPSHLGLHGGDRLGTCDQQPCGTPQVVSQSTENKATAMIENAVVNNEETLKVTVMPNPSASVFTLKLQSKYNAPVQMRITDATGRPVESRAHLGANTTIQVGANFMSGTYYAEFTQGNQRKVLQLIKVR